MQWKHLVPTAAAVVVGLVSFNSASRAGDFASAVTSYAEGTFATVGGQHFTQTGAALGKPSPVVDPGTANASVLTPFSPHFAQTELLAFGLGGHITLQFPQAMGVTGTPQIGLFAATGITDVNWPGGQTGAPATTWSSDEFGAQRTAIVEVAKDPSDFRSLGRITFDDPINYYANATSPYQYPAPDPAQLASFDQPFSGSPTDFSNRNFAGVLAVLNGSAGGTWLSIPAELGLDSVQYVRLSDPKWKLPDGSLLDVRPSIYFPPPNEFIKPADLFLDGAVLIPEPTTASLVLLALTVFRRRR